MIPLLDLKPQNLALQSGIEAAMLRVARSGRYILGPEVESFEQEWARYCGVEHCVGTGNALDALRLILMGFDIGPGDEVIVPSNTYIATWLAVSLAGATPVPVEPLPSEFNIDPLKVEAAITPKTRAILAVHLYGRCASMGMLRAIADERGIYLMEDAAQAHGAVYRNVRAGALSDAAAFSFYPSKNLGAMGDAGAVTTNDGQLATRIRRLRNYGGVGRLDHLERGINSRMDEMQAAILRAKLPFLNSMNYSRRQRASIYLHELAGLDLDLPEWDPGSVWHQFVVRSTKRDLLAQRLEDAGLEAHIHYPVPPHLEAAYTDMKFRRGAFPIAERLGTEVLSLPIGYEFDQSQVIRIIKEALWLK